MVRDLDMTRQALRIENGEAERLRSCLSAMETALAAADTEMATAKVVAG